MSHSCGYRKPIRYEERNAVAGSLPAQYSVKEFIASSTPFLTPSINSKSPTTSLAAKGLNSSSPPVFSLIVPHQALNVWRPIPAGHDVCTFQVVVSAAAALRMKGADTTAVPTTAAAVLSARRRPGCSTVFCCRSLRSVVILPPLGLATNTVPVFAGDRMLHARPTNRKPSVAAVAKAVRFAQCRQIGLTQSDSFAYPRLLSPTLTCPHLPRGGIGVTPGKTYACERCPV